MNLLGELQSRLSSDIFRGIVWELTHLVCETLGQIQSESVVKLLLSLGHYMLLSQFLGALLRDTTVETEETIDLDKTKENLWQLITFDSSVSYSSLLSFIDESMPKRRVLPQ